jgi:enoyl-CoA hydratase/carnithine racemase
VARAVVITGSGDKAFCAGADLQSMQGASFTAMHEGRSYLVELVRRMGRMTKPLVGRVNGAALGGGFGLACACDIVIAVDTATFGTPEIDLGLFPFMIMPLIFRHTNHRKRALEMILTGEKLAAADAQRLGFANRVVPAAELDAATNEVARKLASKSPMVMKLGREAFYRMQELPFDGALDYLKCMLTIDVMTEDAAEGIGAFLEKRAPQWKGA